MKTASRFNAPILLGTLALTLVSWVPPASARDKAHLPHIFAPKGGGTRTAIKSLIDHKGPVLPASHVYAIYWGPVPSGISDALESFFTGFSGSSYANILTQYMRGVPPAPPTSLYTALAPDPSSPPARSPSVNTIVNEVCRSLGVSTPDPAGVYFVITSNFPKSNFCAWHSSGTCNGAPVAVAYLPNVTDVVGCDIASLKGNPFSNGGQSMANVAAHELSESITDPLLNAWYDSRGNEVGDKCAWEFAGPVTLSNGVQWTLQEEWSNAISGCAQSIP